MKIAAFQKVSLIDYPEKICSTIFVQGCNFRCPWCYNPELVTCKSPQINVVPALRRKIKEKEILEYLKKRKGLIEGVCVTGGEPTLQRNLPGFLRKIKKMGFLVKLDTNGSNPEMLRSLLDNPEFSALGIVSERLIDYIAMDIKAPFVWEKYRKVAGIKNRELLNKVLESKNLICDLCKSGTEQRESVIKLEFRTTVVPGFLNKEDIIEIVRQIKGAKRYILQNFTNSKEMLNEEYKNVKPYPKEVLDEMLGEAGKYLKECGVRY